jgi:endonuclease/exonuclease/phosphatase family metal-dependent hydrolase
VAQQEDTSAEVIYIEELSNECTTVQPGPDWICAGGNWYPPTMTLPDGEPPATPALSASPTACTTVQPGSGWTCAGGNWYPPGMTPPPSQTAAALAVVAPSAACTTVQPGPGWACAGGNWYPPGITPPGDQSIAPLALSAASTGCTTVQPGAGWTCAGGNWYPPGMTAPVDEPPVSPPPVAASTVCTTVQPGAGWSCAGGNWYPPDMTSSAGEPTTTFEATAAPAEWYPPADSTPSAAPPASNGSTGVPAANGSTGGHVRVMTWNIAFGHGDPWGQAHAIASSGADVVLLQEAQTFDLSMPHTYPAALQQLTGHRWYGVWSPHGGRYTDNEGTLILSRLPLVDQSTMNAHERGFSRVLVDVGGVHVNIFNAHLDWDDTGRRSAQLIEFMSWMRNFGGPRIAGGDFNSWWGEWWIRQMEAEYSDTWQDVTGTDEDGYTLNGAVRFDYLFRSYDHQWRLTPLSCWVQWTGLSDHAAVVADYAVR